MREMRNSSYAPSQILSDESASAFMGKVYRWMVGGLALTAVTAFWVATSPAMLSMVVALRWPLIIAQFGVVMALSFLANRISGPVAAALFLGYSFITGLTFSVLFLAYGLGSVASAFAITAGAFGALSIYATVTKRDLSAMRTFLFMGLIGIVIASIVNIFLHNGMMAFVINCAAILVFSGLTAYDTQKLRQYHAQMGGSSAGSIAIIGALTLYLDFINLFLSILQVMGRRRD